jgi:signal transduction histidine kinase
VRVRARIPIRLRVTLAFAVAMAVVLSAAGLFLYVRVAGTLDRTIDDGLHARTEAVGALVRQGVPVASTGQITQVLDANGRPVGGAPRTRLLDAGQVRRATAAAFVLERPVPGDDELARLLATPFETAGGPRIVVVGSSLEQRGDALENLLVALLIGGPLALLLASIAGYGLAAAALRPVESMRREAEEVSATQPGRRLSLPPARDEVGRLGETLNSMLARLEAAFAREQRFVTEASHELRTPLASLRTELELALRRKRTKEELEAAVRSAAEETERLVRLAEDLLVLARAHGGSLPLAPEGVRSDELLRRVGDRYARRAGTSGRTIEIDADPELVLVVDRVRAEQALGNLVENALHYGRGRIVLRARREDGRVELHVLDEGPGLAPAFAERAFEPFSRGDSNGRSDGSGLGLAIVDVIARAHGGAARAAYGEGASDIWLELPG